MQVPEKARPAAAPDAKADAPRVANPSRVDWVDHAKGFCIVFVVMMHATLGVEKAAGAEGFMHLLVQFAKPFRMPDFFLISGLFLGLVIDRPWRRYLDRKVVHFLYFYLLWMTIQFAFKAPAWIAEGAAPAEALQRWLLAFVEPFGTLWFIYLLPVFFVVTRLLRPVAWPLVLAGAAVLEIAPVHTGAIVIDEFASRYVYFFAGYALAANIFALAALARRHAGPALLFLGLWAALNGIATFTPAGALPFLPQGAGAEYLSDLPVLSLALGAAGAVAVILGTSLLAKLPGAKFLGYLGRNSIVVYLAFFLPMAVARVVLLKFAPGLDIGVVSLASTLAGVVGPVALKLAVDWSGYGKFLFNRPQWATIDRPAAGGSPRPSLAPAE
jgi:uncharacterized membrane protein YcfT